jgi:hypothetical protein
MCRIFCNPYLLESFIVHLFPESVEMPAPLLGKHNPMRVPFNTGVLCLGTYPAACYGAQS